MTAERGVGQLGIAAAAEAGAGPRVEPHAGAEGATGKAPASCRDEAAAPAPPPGRLRPGSPFYLLLLAAAVGIAALLGGLQSLARPGPAWAIPAALPSGAVLVFASLAFTSLSVGRALRTGATLVREGLGPAGLARATTLHCLAVSLAEELVFRAGLQPRFADPWVGIPAVAALFALLHILASARRFEVLRALDLFGFALVLGLVYHGTGNVYAVATLHFIRNQCLSMLGTAKGRDPCLPVGRESESCCEGGSHARHP